ncbi:MAG: hypothetical protein CR217_17340 [Beijerinckiaceae bacterium]|nr:MAG: hypothetical protein CR217_17340 [Beijerinckiaceae bacterium]
MVAAAAVQAVSATARWRGVPFHGVHSSRRFAGRSRDFARTLASQAGGATDTAVVAEFCEGGPALQAILIRSYKHQAGHK